MAKRKSKILEFIQEASEAAHNECIPWPYAVSSSGYGTFQIYEDGKPTGWLGHRVSCYFKHGEPPPDKPIAAHTCPSNKLCINGNHLRWATYSENNADMLAHDTHVRGERCVTAKLTEDGVHDLRRSLARGESQYSIARRLGISTRQVRSVRDKRDWAWLETP